MEQRYYSVTSAAGLIEKMFANESVKVECAKADDSGNGSTWALEIGDFKIGEESGKAHNLTQDEKKKLSLPELTALYYLQQEDAKDKISFNTTWSNLDFSSYNEFQAAQFTLTTKIPTTASGVPANVNDKAKVSITESFDSYGRLALTVSSAPSEDAGKADNAYALTLLFDIDGDTAGSTESVKMGTIAWRPAGISVGGSAEVTP